MSLLPRKKQPPQAFSSIRQDNAPRQLTINPSAERVTTVLASSSMLEGNLAFGEGLKVDCRIKGTVSFGQEDGLGIVSKGAMIEGDFIGPRALILGEVQGNVRVSGLVVLGPSAVVVGTLQCGRLVVYDGANILGNIETIRDKASSSADQIADASRVEPVEHPHQSVVQLRKAM